MLDINLTIDNLAILNIQEDDILYLCDYLKREYIPKNKEIEINNIYEKFLEYYISENEFFLKINNMETNEMVGIIKGRVDFKNPHEAWIWFIFLDNSIRNKGIGSIILKNLSIYLKEEYGVREIYTRITREDSHRLSFWIKNGYEILRISRDFGNIDNKKTNVFILKKIIGRSNNGQIYAMEK